MTKWCKLLGVIKSIWSILWSLEDDKIKAILDKILELWAAYHYYADMICEYPLRKAYTMLLDVWEESAPLYATGEFHFDFYSETEIDSPIVEGGENP